MKINEIVGLSFIHPELYRILDVKLPRGILLYEPSDTDMKIGFMFQITYLLQISDKTLIAHAVSNKTDAAFFLINSSKIIRFPEVWGKSGR